MTTPSERSQGMVGLAIVVMVALFFAWAFTATYFWHAHRMAEIERCQTVR